MKNQSADHEPEELSEAINEILAIQVEDVAKDSYLIGEKLVLILKTILKIYFVQNI